jgi:hypothetical protein
MVTIEDLRFSSSSIDDIFTSTPRTSRVASSGGRIRVASSGDLAGFAQIGTDTLVHLSQQDFWKLAQDEDGNYFIERLVEDDSVPVRG